MAAVLSLQAFRTARDGERRLASTDLRVSRDHRAMKQLWFLIAVTMVLLGINKQLDLQTLLIQKVRNRAYANGWYTDRRRYQLAFIAAMSFVGLLATAGVVFWLRRVFSRVVLAIGGLGMLVLFVVIRAASFHYVDEALSVGREVPLNTLIELSGIGLIIAAALQWLLVERRRLGSYRTSAPQARDLSWPPPSIV